MNTGNNMMQIRFEIITRAILSLFLCFPILYAARSEGVASYLVLGSGSKPVRSRPLDQTYGGKWVEVTSPTQDTLLSCDFTSADNGWAVGKGVFHWDGEEWIKVLDKQWPPYYSVKMISETDGWIVGGEGSILHWDGNSWNSVESPTDLDLYDVSFIAPDHGWAVGGNPDYLSPPGYWNPKRILLEWNGKEWKEVAFPKNDLINTELKKIIMFNPNEGWVLGATEQYHWNGKTWEEHRIADEDSTNIFLSISALSADNIWIAGYDLSERRNSPQLGQGIIYQWDGKDWKVVYHSGKYPILSIHMLSSDFGWAVGGDDYSTFGGSIILQWNGKVWQEVPSPTTYPLQFVFGLSETDGWILAGGFSPNAGYKGTILRYATEIEPEISPTATVSVLSTPKLHGTFVVQPTATKAAETDRSHNEWNQLCPTVTVIGLIVGALIILFLIKIAKQ